MVPVAGDKVIIFLSFIALLLALYYYESGRNLRRGYDGVISAGEIQKKPFGIAQCLFLLLAVILTILPPVLAFADPGPYTVISGQPDRTGLVAEYRFDGDATDSSGNGADGTITGGTFVDGIRGKAISFNGANTFVSIDPENITPVMNELTISTWVSVDGSPMELGGIITRISQDANYRAYYGMWYDGRYTPNTVCAGKNEVNEYYKLVRDRVELNKWTYVTAVISPQRGVQELYINGDLVKQVSSYDGIRKSDVPVIIGADVQPYQTYQTYQTYHSSTSHSYDSPTYQPAVYYRFFYGKIDEMQVYNRSLTAGEVKKLYLSYLAPTPTPTTTITPPGQVSRNYPMGFDGLRFNADGRNTLDLDLGKAQVAGATVTQYPDRVEVYQHNSPGVTMTFKGDRFETTGGTIKGTVSAADFVTDPLEATFSHGDISGSIRAVLPVLTQQVVITNIMNSQVGSDLSDQFRTVSEQNGLRMDSIAYTFEVRKDSLLRTGPANVTLSIPASWVEQHGGKDAVHIVRVSDKTGIAEVIATVYVGTDSKGIMFFRGDSPNGSSIFGMITAKATAIKEQENPGVTIQPLQKPAIATDIGMFGWLFGLIQQNPVVFLIVVAVIAAALYFGWWKRR